MNEKAWLPDERDDLCEIFFKLNALVDELEQNYTRKEILATLPAFSAMYYLANIKPVCGWDDALKDQTQQCINNLKFQLTKKIKEGIEDIQRLLDGDE